MSGERGNSKHEAAPPDVVFQSSAEAVPSCGLLWATSEQSTPSWQGVVMLGCAPYSGGGEEGEPLLTDALALLTSDKKKKITCET